MVFFIHTALVCKKLNAYHYFLTEYFIFGYDKSIRTRGR